MQTSAKTGANVEAVFMKAVTTYLNNPDARPLTPLNRTPIPVEEPFLKKLTKRFAEWHVKQQEQLQLQEEERIPEKQNQCCKKALLQQLDDIFKDGHLPEVAYNKRKSVLLEELLQSIAPEAVKNCAELAQLADIHNSGYLPELEYLKRRVLKLTEIVDQSTTAQKAVKKSE